MLLARIVSHRWPKDNRWSVVIGRTSFAPHMLDVFVDSSVLTSGGTKRVTPCWVINIILTTLGGRTVIALGYKLFQARAVCLTLSVCLSVDLRQFGHKGTQALQQQYRSQRPNMRVKGSRHFTHLSMFVSLFGQFASMAANAHIKHIVYDSRALRSVDSDSDNVFMIDIGGAHHLAAVAIYHRVCQFNSLIRFVMAY